MDDKLATGSYKGSFAMGATVKEKIMQLLDENVKGLTAKIIASIVGANRQYVSKCLRQLYGQGKIYREDNGWGYRYFTKCYYPSFMQRQQQASNVTFNQVHGLCMKFKYDLATGHGLGLGLGSNIKFGRTYPWKYQPFRIVSFRFGANGTFTLWLNASDAPLGFEEFKHFLSKTEGQFRLPIWTALDDWLVVQYGMNRDIGMDADLHMQTDERVILYNLGQFMCQIYQKTLPEIGPVQRLEMHAWEPIIAKEFFAIFQGGVSEYMQKQMATATNALVRELANEFKGYAAAFKHFLRRNQENV